MKYFYNLVVLMILLACLAAAAEFPTFSIDRYDGWVETTDDGPTIRLIPFLVPPGEPRYWEDSHSPRRNVGIETLSDGRTKVGFKVVKDLQYVDSSLLVSKISEQMNIPIGSLRQHKITFIRPKYSRVELEIAGKIAHTHLFPTQSMTGSIVGYFYVSPQEAASIREGDFRMLLKMEYPLATYSSFELSIDSVAASKAWSSVVREIRERTQESGIHFGPFDFTRRYRRSYVNEQVHSGASNRFSTQTSVVQRDPTPEQLKLINDVLGLVETTREDTLKAHQSAYREAFDAGKIKLAEAHEKYAENLKVSTSGKGELSKEVLAKLGALSEQDVISFFIAGAHSEESTGSGFYKYRGSSFVEVQTATHTSFKNYLIRNSEIEATNIAVPTNSTIGFLSPNFMGELYGERELGPKNWALGIAEALARRRFSIVQYGLGEFFLTSPIPMIDLNVPLNNDEDRIAHQAVKAGDAEILKRLLETGADPLRKNRHGLTAFDIAPEKLREVMTPFVGRKSSINIDLTHPAGARVFDFRIINPIDSGELKVETISKTITRLSISDFPMILQANILFKYEIELRSTNPSLPSILTQGEADIVNNYRIQADSVGHYEEELKLYPAQGWGTREKSGPYFKF